MKTQVLFHNFLHSTLSHSEYMFPDPDCAECNSVSDYIKLFSDLNEGDPIIEIKKNEFSLRLRKFLFGKSIAVRMEGEKFIIEHFEIDLKLLGKCLDHYVDIVNLPKVDENSTLNEYQLVDMILDSQFTLFRLILL
ncbi:MAG: hypothetical protein [Chaetfec virus UA24_2735]|nr:MAG: hypothetical protein [Chaetfec virus UA24_2735]